MRKCIYCLCDLVQNSQNGAVKLMYINDGYMLNRETTFLYVNENDEEHSLQGKLNES